MGFDMQAIVWLVLLVVLLAIEAVTLGLTTIWFAGGALVAFVLALAGAGLFIQIAVFCVISVILLIFTRPVAAGWLNHGRVRTNAQSLIGETAVVTEEIDNLADALLPAMIEFFQSEEGQREFAAWLEKREKEEAVKKKDGDT